MITLVILAGILALLILRWGHLLCVCRQSRLIVMTHDRMQRRDWPAIGLGALYGIALLLCLSRFWDVAHLGMARGLLALFLMIAGVLLRLAGQSALRSAFSWYWTPPPALITSGAYRWMKHPLLTGYLLETASLSIAAPIGSLACSLLIGTTTILIWVQAVGEEKRLDRKFGDNWRAFARGKWA